MPREHEIDEELLTPVRNHVKFPFNEEKKVFKTEKRKILESHVGRDKVRHKVNEIASRETCGKASVKSFRNSFPSSKDGVSSKKHGLVSSVPDHLRKRKEVHPSRKSNLVPNKSQKMMEYGESREAGKYKAEMNEPCEAGKNKVGVKEARKADKSKVSLGERFNNHKQELNIVKPGRVVPADSKHNKTDSIASKEPESEFATLDNDSQRRLVSLLFEIAVSFFPLKICLGPINKFIPSYLFLPI